MTDARSHPVTHRLARAAAVTLLAIATAGPALAAGRIEVSFVKPETFADIGRNAIDRERAIGALREHMASLAPRLPDGQTLKVEVLDVDLAGELQPDRVQGELRVMRGRADWPRISLRYTLSQDGRALKSGEEQLSDMAYLQHVAPISMAGSLPHEQRMIGQWFATRIAAAP